MEAQSLRAALGRMEIQRKYGPWSERRRGHTGPRLARPAGGDRCGVMLLQEMQDTGLFGP